jgi:hypothetical protein
LYRRYILDDKRDAIYGPEMYLSICSDPCYWDTEQEAQLERQIAAHEAALKKRAEEEEEEFTDFINDSIQKFIMDLYQKQLRADRIARFGTNQPDPWSPDSIQYCKLHQKYDECTFPKPLKTPDCEANKREYFDFMGDVVDGKRNPSPWCQKKR